MTSSAHRSTSSDTRARGGEQQEREAILESLYEERRSLLRRKRSEAITSSEEEYLDELNRYIDYWEMAETHGTQRNDVWRRLEELAASVLDIQAKIERQRK